MYVCGDGNTCMERLSELNASSVAGLVPTIVLLDIPYEEELETRATRRGRTPSPGPKDHLGGFFDEVPPLDNYGLTLLQRIVSDVQYQTLSGLVVPVAVVTIPKSATGTGSGDFRPHSAPGIFSMASDPFNPKKPASPTSGSMPLDQARTVTCLDVGAVDVLTSPLSKDRIPSLACHAYRAHKDVSREQQAVLDVAQGRKRSWVGLDDHKPYAYLREAMVSGLMDGICKPGELEPESGHAQMSIPEERQQLVANAIGTWHFSAHDFSDDELLHGALLILQHALTMPELEQWRITTGMSRGYSSTLLHRETHPSANTRGQKV